MRATVATNVTTNKVPMDLTQRRDAVRHLSGPAALAAFAFTYNVLAYRAGRPTISAGVRWVARQNMGTEVAGAVAGGLLAHWFLRLIED